MFALFVFQHIVGFAYNNSYPLGRCDVNYMSIGKTASYYKQTLNGNARWKTILLILPFSVESIYYPTYIPPLRTPVIEPFVQQTTHRYGTLCKSTTSRESKVLKMISIKRAPNTVNKQTDFIML